ncbi:hypothetical protein DTL42_02155 [Bremerella cremea]|uniref:Uncharacterized protein n=1 Tax=Bremerella cremea TaxID=1031537 RepID=A0A368KX07_9BACT|nr:hypothetical protein [Bremerella cremea]RCS53984.1 hypothetical protein DTL42_02155 [Bremerella cremea]
MRIVVATFCALFILGFTWLYQQTLAENQLPERDSVSELIAESYHLRITATFDAGLDPFAEDVSEAASLSISYEGKAIFTENQAIPAGKVIECDLELEIPPGKNEFLVQMSPANAAEAIPKAVQVELFRRGFDQPLESRTIWAGANDSLVVGRVPFEVPESAVPE